MPDEKLADSVDIALEESIAISQAQFEAAIELLNKDIQRLLGRIETTADGTIKGPTVTLRTAAKLQTQLTTLFRKTYGNASRNHIRRYRGILALVERVYQLLGESGPVGFTEVNSDTLKAIAGQDSALLNAIGREAQAKVTNFVYSNVLGMGNVDDLSRDIAGVLVGHVDVRGTPLSTYADTYAQDQIMQYHSRANKAMGDQLDVGKWWYVGDRIKTSRQFCIDHAGETKTTDEWEDLGQNTQWAGKSCSEIFICRGGYNCRHHFQAIIE